MTSLWFRAQDLRSSFGSSGSEFGSRQKSISALANPFERGLSEVPPRKLLLSRRVAVAKMLEESGDSRTMRPEAAATVSTRERQP